VGLFNDIYTAILYQFSGQVNYILRTIS